MKFQEKTYRKSLKRLTTKQLMDALVYEAKLRFERALPKVVVRYEAGHYDVLEAPDDVTIEIRDVDLHSEDKLMLRTYRGTTQESVKSFKRIPKKYA